MRKFERTGHRREQIIDLFDRMEPLTKNNRPLNDVNRRRVKPSFRRNSQRRLPTVVATNHTVARLSE